MNANYFDINVERDRADPDGIFTFYQDLIALRENQAIVTKGSFALLFADDLDAFVYERILNAQRLLVLGNFTDKAIRLEAGGVFHNDGKVILSNMTRETLTSNEHIMLAPYEAFAWLSDI